MLVESKESDIPRSNMLKKMELQGGSGDCQIIPNSFSRSTTTAVQLVTKAGSFQLHLHPLQKEAIQDEKKIFYEIWTNRFKAWSPCRWAIWYIYLQNLFWVEETHWFLKYNNWQHMSLYQGFQNGMEHKMIEHISERKMWLKKSSIFRGGSMRASRLHAIVDVFKLTSYLWSWHQFEGSDSILPCVVVLLVTLFISVWSYGAYVRTFEVYVRIVHCYLILCFVFPVIMLDRVS